MQPELKLRKIQRNQCTAYLKYLYKLQQRCLHVICIRCTMWALLFFTLDAGLMARSQYSEGPATGHLDTGFFLVSLCLKANAEIVPKIPSCHYMLLM